MTQQPHVHHKAVLDVTGWHAIRHGQHFLDGICIHPAPESLWRTRLTASLFPRTDPKGDLVRFQRWSGIRPAHQPNDQYLEVIARLIRTDRALNLMVLHVYPSASVVRPFRLHIRATTPVLRNVDPDWPSVHLTGSLIGQTLVADHVQWVHAPIPERWADWVRGRNPDALARRVQVRGTGTTREDSTAERLSTFDEVTRLTAEKPA